jgi:hypothetical protein
LDGKSYPIFPGLSKFEISSSKALTQSNLKPFWTLIGWVDRMKTLSIYLLVLFSLSSAQGQESPSDFQPLLSPDEPPYYLVLGLQALNQPSGQELDPSKPTRVIVSGEGHRGGEGSVFQESAVSLAMKYQEAYPEEQVVLYFTIEGSLERELKVIQDWKLNVLEQGMNRLGISELMWQLQKFEKIQAFHLFSHAWKDIAVIQGADALTTASDLTDLRGRMGPDSYVIIHGCNTGWDLVPYMTRELGVPASGALTSTNFERLHSTGNFYFNDEPAKPEGPWAVKNLLSYQQPRSCYRGVCMRMKPDNHSYVGLHGRLSAGLPFYKFYCPFGAQEICERSMAKALIGFVDLKPLTIQSSEEDFKIVARDWLCPISNRSNIREQCLRALERAELDSSTESSVYSPFRGQLVKCDFGSCWEPEKNETATTFVDEYRAFLRGIRLLKDEVSQSQLSAIH